MYKCRCGYENKRFDWCDKCQKLLKCDCSDVIQGRVKDILIPYKNGDRPITLQYKICDTCGKMFDVSINRSIIAELKQGRK